MKRLFLSITLLVLLSTSTCFASTTNIIINNQPVNFTEQTGQPFIENNHTLVPMRVVMEQYGCIISWSQSLQTVTITKGNSEVKVPIGQNYILVNNQAQPIEVPAQVINGKTYLPIRAILEGVGAKVEWNQVNKSVVVNGENVKNSISDDMVANKENKIIKGENQQLTYEEFLSLFDVSIEQISDFNQTVLIYKQDIKRDDLRNMLQKIDNIEELMKFIANEYYNEKFNFNNVIVRTNKSKSHTVADFSIGKTGNLSYRWLYKPETID